VNHADSRIQQAIAQPFRSLPSRCEPP